MPKRTPKSRKVRSAWRLTPSQKYFLNTFWIHILFIVLMVNFAVVKSIQIFFYAASCMTRPQVANDNRCLYIYGNTVYEKGTRTRPHKGNACGIDITTKIPSSHPRNAAKFLDPNVVATVCDGTQVQPSPTKAPTATPTRAATASPTRTPTQSAVATATPIPSATLRSSPFVTQTPRPIVTSHIFSSPTPTTKPLSFVPSTLPATPIPSSTPKATSTPSPIAPLSSPSQIVMPPFQYEPTPTQSLPDGQAPPKTGGFGSLMNGSSQTPPLRQERETSEEPIPEPDNQKTPENLPITGQTWSSVVLWSEILAIVSFVLLITTILVGAIKSALGMVRK